MKLQQRNPFSFTIGVVPPPRKEIIWFLVSADEKPLPRNRTMAKQIEPNNEDVIFKSLDNETTRIMCGYIDFSMQKPNNK